LRRVAGTNRATSPVRTTTDGSGWSVRSTETRFILYPSRREPSRANARSSGHLLHLSACSAGPISTPPSACRTTCVLLCLLPSAAVHGIWPPPAPPSLVVHILFFYAHCPSAPTSDWLHDCQPTAGRRASNPSGKRDGLDHQS
jgi:hypothetical protein